MGKIFSLVRLDVINGALVGHLLRAHNSLVEMTQLTQVETKEVCGTFQAIGGTGTGLGTAQVNGQEIYVLVSHNAMLLAPRLSW